MRWLLVGEPVDLGGHPVVPDGVLDQFGSALGAKHFHHVVLAPVSLPSRIGLLATIYFGRLRAQH
jgi:hypothetical protein